MDTMLAFAMGEAHRHCKKKVFDWDKAARRIKEAKPHYAEAGLEEDWECTGGRIYEKGKIKEDAFVYLASTWATPVLDMDGETEECWVMEDATKWGAYTYWPESARKILDGKVGKERE